jgi:hypothetical protein
MSQKPVALLLTLAIFAAVIIPAFLVQSRREGERRSRVDEEGYRIWLEAN